MKAYVILLSMGLAIVACDPPTTESTEEPIPIEQSNFKMERFYASFENCESTDENCTYFEVSYPFFKGNQLEAVNQFIDGIKSPVFDPELRTLPLDSIATDFITNYSDFKRDFPESSQSWFMKHSLQMEDENDSSILISAAINEYGGGAHGNYAINYYQVGKETGKPIQLLDIYSQEEVDRMSIIMSVSVDPSISLLTETISPTENFILGQDSITFIYNPYEIAPYSEGVIRLTLPRDQSPIM